MNISALLLLKWAMSPHPVLMKQFIRFQMITVVSWVVLGAVYGLGLLLNYTFLLNVLDPIISIVANVGFYGLFVVPIGWIIGKFIFVKAFSRHVDIELKERLRRLVFETLSRMNINPKKTRFVVHNRSSSASVRRGPFRDTVAVGEQLLRDASDEEIMGILGHEFAHVLKGHLRIKGFWNVLSFFAFLAIVYRAAVSHSAAILGVTGLLALFLAGIPLNWRIEYSADRFSAEKLGPTAIVSALKRLRMFYPDCVSFTHPPLSRRIRRIQSLSITPLITHVYA
jgi:Zn-dependent protease with chaperone function